MFDDLVKWVDQGIPPQSAGDATHEGILATGPGNFGTRPICPWPTTPIYNGAGPTTVASNYTCGGNLDTYTPNAETNHVATVCQEVLLKYGEETHSQLDYKELGIIPGECEGNNDTGNKEQ